jgi:hypothetical protein
MILSRYRRFTPSARFQKRAMANFVRIREMVVTITANVWPAPRSGREAVYNHNLLEYVEGTSNVTGHPVTCSGLPAVHLMAGIHVASPTADLLAAHRAASSGHAAGLCAVRRSAKRESKATGRLTRRVMERRRCGGRGTERMRQEVL